MEERVRETVLSRHRALKPSHDRDPVPSLYTLRALPKPFQIGTVGPNVYIDNLAQPSSYTDRTRDEGQRRQDGCPIIFGGHCISEARKYS